MNDEMLEVSGMAFPCRIDRPDGAMRAALVLIPGSLFLDVDGNYPAWNLRPETYRELGAQLAARGVAVLRYAKPGPGTGTIVTDADLAKRHGEFALRVEVAAAAVARLRDAVGDVPVFIAGHSEGALVASLLAARDPAIAGVVSLAGPALRIFDIMRAQLEASPPPGAGDHGAGMAAFDAAIATAREVGALPAAAAAHPYTMMFASIGDHGVRYLRSQDRVDPVAAIAAVPQPVLLVQGGRDASVTSAQVDALAAGRSGPTEVARFDELQHFFKVAPPGTSAVASFALVGPTDPRVAEAIAAWIARAR